MIDTEILNWIESHRSVFKALPSPPFIAFHKDYGAWIINDVICSPTFRESVREYQKLIDGKNRTKAVKGADSIVRFFIDAPEKNKCQSEICPLYKNGLYKYMDSSLVGNAAQVNYQRFSSLDELMNIDFVKRHTEAIHVFKGESIVEKYFAGFYKFGNKLIATYNDGYTVMIGSIDKPNDVDLPEWSGNVISN